VETGFPKKDMRQATKRMCRESGNRISGTDLVNESPAIYCRIEREPVEEAATDGRIPAA
jgi:hypothetical protein